MSLDCETSLGKECKPIRTVKELLNFDLKDCDWKNLVKPLKSRSEPRYLGENCHNFCDTLCDLEGRAQILACHDYRGNYLYDRFVAGTEDWNE